MGKYEVIIVVKGEKGKIERAINCTDHLMGSETGYILIDLIRDEVNLSYWPPDKKWPPDGLKEHLNKMLIDIRATEPLI